MLATDWSTRKCVNLRADPRVSLLVDSRSNRRADFQDAAAVTIIGGVEDVAGAERAHLLSRFLAKHPDLEGLATSPSGALVGVRVKSYVLVTRFQEVVELYVG